jgi:hypothetical protein
LVTKGKPFKHPKGKTTQEQPNLENNYIKEDSKYRHRHLQPCVTIRLHTNNKLLTCLSSSYSLANLLWPPLHTNPPVDFLMVKGCVWCGLKETSSKWEKDSSFLGILTWVNNGEGSKTSREIRGSNNSYFFHTMQSDVLSLL